MSAIAGAWRLDGAPLAAAACDRLLAAQAPFGPHASDRWDDYDIALGRRLYRLTPEDRHDRQPVVGASGAVLCADVRLDNRAELRAALGVSTARADGLCDAALLLGAWERWGEACFDHIVGPYAFAVWQPGARRLTLARDPLGLRPLHYHRAAGVLAFASMPAALNAIIEGPIAPDLEHLATFLALAPDSGPSSFFKNIQRVEPGAMLVLDPAGARMQRHWPPPHRPLGLSAPTDIVEGFRERLDQAVEAQLRGAGDLAATHLSSGWDSAAVTATAARAMAARGGRILALTAVPSPRFADPAIKGRCGDEGPLAAIQAARDANIEHIRIESQGRSPLDDLDIDAALSGVPMTTPCNQVWCADINTAARARGASVILTGEFGNLSLTYEGVDGLPDLIARRRWRAWLGHARALTRSGAMRWRAVVGRSFEPFGPSVMWRVLRRLNGAEIVPINAFSPLRAETFKAHADSDPRPGSALERRMARLQGCDVSALYKAELARFGTDARQPLADRRLIEFSLAVPWESFLGEGRPRALPARVLADRVAPEILSSPIRGYQAADWHVGLTAARPEIEAELERLAQWPPTADLLDIPRLRALVRRWPADGWRREAVIANYRAALLRGLAAGRFARRAAGANA